MKTKNISKKLLAMVIMISLVSAAFCVTAFADTMYDGVVNVDVSQVFDITGTGEADDAIPVQFELTALDPSNPMPAGSEGSTFRFTVTGDDDYVLGPIICTAHGEYQYELRVLSVTADGVTADDEVYLITIYAVDKAADGIFTTLVIENSDSEKVEVAAFVQDYNTGTAPTTAEPTTPSTGDNPKTGDAADMTIYYILIAASALVLFLIFFLRRKKEKSEE